MRDEDDRIRCVGEHRGVGLHDCQDEARLAVVRGEIDEVLALGDIQKLTQLCGNVRWSPEARLTAAAKLEAIFELAAEDREVRPNINLPFVHACVTGLDSRRWRSPRAYGSLLDPGAEPGSPGAVLREVPLQDEA